MRKLRNYGFIVAAVFGALSGAAAAAEVPSAERGLAFAQRNCAVCHAIGKAGDSPFSAAPPFRVVVQRSPADYLVKLLEEGLGSDHNAYQQMRYFVLSKYEAEDLAAYWKTLESEPSGER